MAKATLDGHPLLDGEVSWSMRAGVVPHTAHFEVTPDAARALVGGALKPVSLVLESPGAKGARIDNLYVIEDRPGPDRNVAVVRVVDRRWFWPFVHVDHAFNVRRNVGYKRVRAGFGAPEIDPVRPDVRYAPWSLDGTQPWTAERALQKVWETVAKCEEETSGAAPALHIDPSISKLTGESMPIEDMELSDDGAAALGRILDFIPGARITVDPDGSVRVYSIADGSDARTFDRLLPEQEGGGHAEVVTNSRIRPREVRIFFAPEAEIRLDFEEPAQAGGSVALGQDDPYIENVLPVPDYSLEVAGLGTVAQGTWITVGQALSSWGEIPNFGTLDYRALRRASVPYMDLWTGTKIAGLGDATADWGGRIAALQQHFRRTYRINQRIVRSVRAIKAHRVATINTADGSRAPATAYQDWAVVATQRFLAVRIAAGARRWQYAENFEGYPDGGLLENARSVSPVDVSVVDQDQGIIRLEVKQDIYRVHEMLLPSRVENIPHGDLTAGGIIAWNAGDPGSDIPELASGHKVIVVLTVVPAAPNGKERLFRMVRRPSDVSGILPSSLQGGLSDAQGPPIDIHVGPGWETARIAWNDSQRSRILNALALGSPNAKGDVSSLSDLVLNVQSQDALGESAASLDAIANALAAAVYAGFADRMEGTRTAPVDGDAVVRGFIERVIHRVLPSGEATSTADSSERQSPLGLMSALPTSARRVILRMANQ